MSDDQSYLPAPIDMQAHQPDTQEFWINFINLQANGWTSGQSPPYPVAQLPPPGYPVLHLPPPSYPLSHVPYTYPQTEVSPPVIVSPYAWPLSVATPPDTNHEVSTPPTTKTGVQTWHIVVGAILIILLVSSMVSISTTTKAPSVDSSRSAWVDQVPTTAGTWNEDCPQTTLSDSGNPYAIVGEPDLSADFVNRVLAYYHSPAAGDGQKLIDATSRCGIKVSAALAFFMHESTLGTQGEATSTHSLGNMRCVKAIQQVTCVDQDRGGYAQMPNWTVGFVLWSRMMRNQYVDQWGEKTIDQIIPTYAPNSDHNSESGYTSSWKYCIDTWHRGVIAV